MVYRRCEGENGNQADALQGAKMTYNIRHTDGTNTTLAARRAELRDLDAGKGAMFTDWDALADGLGDERRFDAWKRRARALRFVR